MENNTAIIHANNKTQHMVDLEDTHKMCALLMRTPHYAKMGQEGIFAIIETSKSLGIDPRTALQGGLYYVKGKVEMSARMMNSLIRSRKHSITRDAKSDDTICILHGKRSDNGDTWTESFSLKEAEKAGLVRNGGPWQTFTRDMLFARALSRLARQLFPDIIGNCYVEGEIALDPNIPSIQDVISEPTVVEKVEPKISEDQLDYLLSLIDADMEFRIKEKYEIVHLSELTVAQAKKCIDHAKKLKEAKFEKVEQIIEVQHENN